MTYDYDRRSFGFNVTFIGVFCAALALAAIVGCFMDPAPLPRFILVVIAIVAGYQVLNTFIAIANPSRVILDDDELAFGAYGRLDRYPIKDIKEIDIREFPDKERMYVRVNGGGLLRGRYWVRTGQFADGEELYDRLVALELKLMPHSLKARARRGR